MPNTFSSFAWINNKDIIPLRNGLIGTKEFVQSFVILKAMLKFTSPPSHYLKN